MAIATAFLRLALFSPPPPHRALTEAWCGEGTSPRGPPACPHLARPPFKGTTATHHPSPAFTCPRLPPLTSPDAQPTLPGTEWRPMQSGSSRGCSPVPCPGESAECREKAVVAAGSRVAQPAVTHKGWRRAGVMVPLSSSLSECGWARGTLEEAPSPRHAPAGAR